MLEDTRQRIHTDKSQHHTALASLGSTIASLESKVLTLQDERNHALKSIKASRDADLNQIAMLQAKVDRLIEDNETLKEARQLAADKTLREENDQFIDEITVEKLAVESMSNQLAVPTSEKKELQDSLRRADRDLGSAYARIATLSEQDDKLLNRYNKAISDQDKCRREMRDHQESYAESCEELLKEAREANAALSTLRLEYSDARFQIGANMSRQVMDLDHKLKAQFTHVRRLLTDLLAPRTHVNQQHAAVNFPMGFVSWTFMPTWPAAATPDGLIAVPPAETLLLAIVDLTSSLNCSPSVWQDDCSNAILKFSQIADLAMSYTAIVVVEDWKLRLIDHLLVSTVHEDTQAFVFKLAACFVLRVLEPKWPAANTTSLASTGLMPLPAAYRGLIDYLVLGHAPPLDTTEHIATTKDSNGKCKELIWPLDDSKENATSTGLLLIDHTDNTFRWVHSDRLATVNLDILTINDP
ncbi:hypothetical protein QQS21_009323 [Conoideocrella luteorostrata]|uniref:Uncharacterized protein n=1 Tax=Conoideocrella luteorostrata TaxID=1105319 RepID=A0AAJ0FXX0_9HYPO|nr:hypothetical protein QQS21_009323 [Conoideocrella luteorostrata]